MKKSHTTLIISVVFIFLACNNSTKKIEIITPNLESLENSKKTSLHISKAENTTENEVVENDSLTKIKFNELSIFINKHIIFDEEKKLNQINKDTVNIFVELGETIENQKIKVYSQQITDLIIEQRYETSVTISNEGPHCDLNDWKHFYSEWKPLSKNGNGEFICEKYSEKENEKFPIISIDDLKKKVKEHCGEEWEKLMTKIKTPNEYPSGVSISRYYLRITGKRIDDGELVTKLIIIETPMGC